MSTVFSAFTLAYSLFEVPSGWLGRRDRSAARADAHRAVVVGVHDAHRARRRAAGRSWPSGSCSAPARPARFRTRCGASRSGSRRASAAWPTACCSSARGWAARSPRRWRCCSFSGGAGGPASSSSALSVWSGRRRGTARIAIAPRSTRTSIAEELAWIQQDIAFPTRIPTAQRPNGPNAGAHAVAALLASPNLYAICAMYFAFGYGLYFYFTWLPTYLIPASCGFSLADRRDSSRRCRFCSPAPPISPAAGAPTRWRARAACARHA